MIARVVERDSLFSVIGGPLVWAVHFLAIYITAALACARDFFHDEILGLPPGLYRSLVREDGEPVVHVPEGFLHARNRS